MNRAPVRNMIRPFRRFNERVQVIVASLNHRFLSKVGAALKIFLS